jgi:hypothetical protein
VIVDAPDEIAMAAVAIAVAAGGAVRVAKTTPLFSGSQWVAAVRKAPAVSAVPPRPIDTAAPGGSRETAAGPSPPDFFLVGTDLRAIRKGNEAWLARLKTC